MTNEKLKKMLDYHFGPPFLPEGLVQTRWHDSEKRGRLLTIKIGRRDVQFTEDGDVVGSGTEVDCPHPVAPG